MSTYAPMKSTRTRDVRGFDMDYRYDWISFYEKFADTLLAYKTDRKLLIERIQQAYNQAQLTMPKLDSTVIPEDIDPYTVFGLFNKGISDENRKRIIAALAEKLGVSEKQPTEFDGIPVLNNLNATFYAFIDDKRRKNGDIDRLWDLFEKSLSISSEVADEFATKQFTEAFDALKGQFGLSWKLTMGLYWTRPYIFMNLDSRNRWFLSNPETISPMIADEMKSMKSLPTGEIYLGFSNLVRETLESSNHDYKTLPELSYEAWKVSEEVNEENKKKEKEGAAATAANTLGDGDVDSTSYWLYAPGEDASEWDRFYDEGIMGLGWHELGDLRKYDSKEGMRLKLVDLDGGETSQKNSALAVWQFANSIKPGDVIFAKKGRTKILGRGIVESGYDYNPDGDRYPNIRKVNWTNKGEWQSNEQFAMKTLTDVTDYPDFVSKIESFFVDQEGDIEEVEKAYPTYTPEDFLSEVFIDEDEYEKLTGLLKSKKNIILQGAPGVGKTFIAKRLAYSIMGNKNADRVGMVQFHQSYSYEDFIMGFRPNASGGFDLKSGSFYNFRKKAVEDSDHDYFFIIDEINRGNLSRIFGELFMLIESDKRGPRNKLQLLYSDELFYIPENLYIIGMMNTADRSLAMLDYALRRRFAFYDLKPGFATEGFREYRESLGNEKFDKLIARIEDLNARIAEDETLGPGYCIGHSFFCNLTVDEIEQGKLLQIVNYEIVPLLSEYWFDDPNRVRDWADRLRSAVK